MEPVSSAAFSPDGQQIVTASSDGTVRIWDTAKGRLLSTLVGGDWRYVEPAASFSPNGQRILGVGNEIFRVWDAANNRVLLEWGRSDASYSSAAFSPDGQRIALAESDGYGPVSILDSTNGQTILKLERREGSARSAVFSPNGKRIVTVGYDDVARVWSATMARRYWS